MLIFFQTCTLSYYLVKRAMDLSVQDGRCWFWDRHVISYDAHHVPHCAPSFTKHKDASSQSLKCQTHECEGSNVFILTNLQPPVQTLYLYDLCVISRQHLTYLVRKTRKHLTLTLLEKVNF